MRVDRLLGEHAIQADTAEGRIEFQRRLEDRPEQRAERLVQGWLERCQWTEGDLVKAAKGDRRKAELAVQLREQTTMTRQWIAQRLAMGSASYVSHLTGRQSIVDC